MNKTEQEKFYLAVMAGADLDSVEADIILQAQGLDPRTHSLKDCIQSVKQELIHVPGGPAVDWESINKRIDNQKFN